MKITKPILILMPLMVLMVCVGLPFLNQAKAIIIVENKPTQFFRPVNIVGTDFIRVSVLKHDALIGPCIVNVEFILGDGTTIETVVEVANDQVETVLLLGSEVTDMKTPISVYSYVEVLSPVGGCDTIVSEEVGDAKNMRTRFLMSPITHDEIEDPIAG